MAGEGTIRLIRERRGRRDRLRAYSVLLDGHAVAKIRAQQTIELPTDSGSHTVEIAIDWTRSPSLDVRVGPGQTVELRCAPNTRIPPLAAMTARRKEYVSLWPAADPGEAPPRRQQYPTPWLHFVTLVLLLAALALAVAAGRTGDAVLIGVLLVAPVMLIGLWIYAKRGDHPPG